MVKKFVVGDTPGAPTINSDHMIATFLENCVVDFLVVDEVPFSGMGASPNYIQNVSEGRLTLPGYSFQYGCCLLISYTPFCPVISPCQPI
jgi:hypothetical protein